MKITIAERLRPFSHTPGSGCLIPGTWWQIQAFPTLLRLSHKSQVIEIALKITGPVKDFTLQLDLEKGAVYIFGKAQEGYFRLRLEAIDSGFNLYAEKTPTTGLSTSKGDLQPKGHLHFPVQMVFSVSSSAERISFGSHKEQDWDLASRRSDLREIIPQLLFLGKKTPHALAPTPILPEKKPEKSQIEPLLQSFIQAHFKQILVPRLLDEQHLGMAFPVLDSSAEPSILLGAAVQWIRSLFFVQNERRLQILPLLLPSTDCGRFISIVCPGIGTLDFEWSKFLLRKLILKVTTPGEILFDLQKEIESFRVRKTRFEKGRRQKSTEPLLVEPGKTYFLDNFQK